MYFCFYGRIIAKLHTKEKYFDMGEKPQAIDFSKKPTSTTEVVAPSSETEITFLEFAVGQEWNSRHFTLKIKELTKSGRYRVYMNDRASGVSELSDPMDTEVLKALILEKGLRLISSGEPVAPKQEESAPVVVDLDAKRLERGDEAVSSDIEADNVARQELARIDGEAADTEQRIFTTVKEIMTLLADAEESDAKDTLQQEVLRISEKVPQILAETESVEQDGMELTEKLGGRQRLLANLQALELHAALLLNQVKQALTDSSGDEGNESASSTAGTGEPAAPEKPKPERKSKGDGGDGGDITWRKELDAFLERPEGREVIGTYKMIVTGEWRYFSDAIWRSKKYISFRDKVTLWEQDERLLPKILKRLKGDLTEKQGATPEQAEGILRAVLGELHQEFLEKQKSKSKHNKEGE